jgi:MFS family permease
MSMNLASGRLPVLAGATIGNMVSMTPAVYSVFGTFLIPLSTTFNWPRAKISAVLTIIALVGAITYPLAGRFADRHGVRGILLLGYLLFAVALGSLAMLDGRISQLYLIYALIGFAGGLPSTALLSKLIADWFDSHRGLALSISAGVGNAIGSIMMPVLAAVLIANAGWRFAYLGIAAVVLCLGFPATFFLLRDAPAAAQRIACTEPAPDLKRAWLVKDPMFWIVLISIGVGSGTNTVIFSHIVPILAEHGIGVAAATVVVSVFALATAVWQVVMGYLLDRYRTPRVVIPLYLMVMPGLGLLEWGVTTPFLVLGGTFLGISCGTQFAALPFFVARYFGIAKFGIAIGLIYSAVIAAQGSMPVLLDASFDALRSYRPAIMIAELFFASCALLILALPNYRFAAPNRNSTDIALHPA